MKNNKNAKIFDFTLLQYYNEYDKYTDEILINLIRTYPDLNSIIKLIIKASLSVQDKISLLCHVLNIIHYLYNYKDGLTFNAVRIANKLFEGTEEYRYRKQFSE